MRKILPLCCVIILLTSCICNPQKEEQYDNTNLNTYENTKDNINGFDQERLINYFKINEKNSSVTHVENDYCNYITYEISNIMNYSENTDILNCAYFNGQKYLRYIKLEINQNNSINNMNINWYVYGKDGTIEQCGSQYYADNIINKMESYALSSELGQGLYYEEYLFAQDVNSSTGIVNVLYCDINNDGINDSISYLEAPWIQGYTNNIQLMVKISGSDDYINLEDELFLSNSSDLPLMLVNIQEANDSKMREIVVEYFYRKTGKYSRDVYTYNKEKGVFSKQE